MPHTPTTAPLLDVLERLADDLAEAPDGRRAAAAAAAAVQALGATAVEVRVSGRPLHAAGASGPEATLAEVPLRSGGVLALSATFPGDLPGARRAARIVARHLATAMDALPSALAPSRASVEERLAAERERLAVTLASIGEAVLTADMQGRVTFLNAAGERLTGWTHGDAVGRALVDVAPLIDERTSEPLSCAMSALVAGTDRSREAMLLPRGSAARPVMCVAAPIRDRAGGIHGAVVVLRDLTDQRRIEAEMVRSSKLESLGVLAGGIAHDFNNILTSILGNLSLTRVRLASDARALEPLADAVRATERARDLTRQLLTFARGGEPVRSVTGLEAIVREAATFALQGSRSRASLTVDPTLWNVEADPSQLGQVLQNLVLNAEQAMPDGGTVDIHAENVVHDGGPALPLPPGRYVRIRVADQGHGIPEDLLSRVFDPFFTTKPQGTGLGLATAYSVVARHRGHLGVDSRAGVGATFTVVLPAVEVATDRVADDAAGELLRTGHGRILVMDDDAAIRDVLAACLEELGYAWEAVEDGEAAVRAHRCAHEAGRPFDALIVDLTVPGRMGGAECVRDIRAIDPAVRAIVSSGYSDAPVMARYRDYGFAGVIRKPYRIEDVGRVLVEVLAAS